MHLIPKNLLLLSLLALWSCLENPADNLQATLDKDKATIADYVAKNQLRGTTTAWGGYHVTEKAGNNKSVNENSVVENDIALFLLSGIRFYRDTAYTFQPIVGSFMQGVTLSVGLMKEKEEARFLIPSFYAFANQSGKLNGVDIPANSIVMAQIRLKAVRTQEEHRIHEDSLIRNYIKTKNWQVTQSENGVYYVRQTEGTGNLPQMGEVVRVSYTGSLLNGTVFDSSPSFSPIVGSASLIEGWNIALKMLKKGEKGTFIIPSHLAYGARGVGGAIGPFQILIFEIERL